MFKDLQDTDTNTHFEDPRDYGTVSTLEVDHLFEETYPDARYSIVVPIDHSDDKLVNTVTKHPHQRFVGRKVRKSFEVDECQVCHIGLMLVFFSDTECHSFNLHHFTTTHAWEHVAL